MDTFVIRVWEPVEGDLAPEELRGTVRCIRTGAEGAFRSRDELLGFVDAHRRTALDGTTPTGLDGKAG